MTPTISYLDTQRPPLTRKLSWGQILFQIKVAFVPVAAVGVIFTHVLESPTNDKSGQDQRASCAWHGFYGLFTLYL